jgi:hypothetical protein
LQAGRRPASVAFSLPEAKSAEQAEPFSCSFAAAADDYLLNSRPRVMLNLNALNLNFLNRLNNLNFLNALNLNRLNMLLNNLNFLNALNLNRLNVLLNLNLLELLRMRATADNGKRPAAGVGFSRKHEQASHRDNRDERKNLNRLHDLDS